MKKIPTLFKRDLNDMRHVTDEITPGCEWVFDGEGVATRKYDGTCMLLDNHYKWWARREVKPGKNPPPNFWVADVDMNTGKTVGWESVEQSPFAKFHREALDAQYGVVFAGRADDTPPVGTYELIGPKVNGNPEKCTTHALVRHGYMAAVEHHLVDRWPTTASEMPAWIQALGRAGWEGVVWHHPDGRMAKLKARDYQ